LSDERVLIEVEGLSKSYGPVRALHGISFSVREGQVLGFLGPNGAGKSTTLRILAGFLPGDSGRVRVAGHDVGADSLAVRRSIGYLPEGVPLYPDMRVAEYLRFRSQLKGIARRQRKRAIDEALEATKTTDVRKRMIGTLSRGFRQRVGLADALLSQPPVLILDEPTVGLDPEQVRQFRQLLKEVGRDRTVILSTHILSEVELVCSDVVIIAQGKIVARDTADKMRGLVGGGVSVLTEIDGPKNEVRKTLAALDGVSRVEVGDASVGRGGTGKNGSKSGAVFRSYRVITSDGPATAEQIYLASSKAGWSLRLLEREALSLEDVFLDVVGRNS
jgi:ABC-2 type transport system ATP-binding protein